MGYLIGLGAALIATILYLWNKKQSAEALLENLDTKEKLGKLNAKAERVSGLIKWEEDKREELTKDAEKEKNKEVTNEDLTDFFNNRKPN